MWSWTNTDYRIGITSPHFQTRQSNHLSVTQPLLADLELDGQPELVLTVVDSTTDDPHIISLPLGASAPTVNWDVTLDRGTHPSDPAWAQLDAKHPLLLQQPSTRTQETCGFGELTEVQGQTIGVVLHIRHRCGFGCATTSLPSPVVVQLDGDAAPEMILTVPTDANGGPLA